MGRNSRGYTLIEMAMVVAMASILAVMGVSSYQKFVIRAREGEATTNLAAIYAAERNFFLNNYTYTLCLKQIGFQPSFIPNYYWTGFQNSAGNNCGPTGTLACNFYDYAAATPSLACDCATVVTDAQGTHTDCAWQNLIDANPGVALDGSLILNATKTTFTAGAQGKISASAAVPDSWTIKQDKTVKRVHMGE